MEEKGWIFRMIIIMSLLLGLAGLLYGGEEYGKPASGAAVGLTCGLSGALVAVLGFFIPAFTPKYVKRDSETPAPVVQAPQVVEQYFVIQLDGARHRVNFFGMTVEQWAELAKLIVNSGAYNQTHFERVLADREKGRSVYYDVSGRLNYNDTFLLVHGNGFKLTDAGLEFFEKVAKGDWRMLDELET